MIGTQFSGYQIIERIGGGNTGTVFKAQDNRTDQTVALKILANDFLVTREKQARFLREAHAISTLKHPAIARVCEVGEHENYSYLAMEYVDGHTFTQIIEQEPAGVGMDRFYQLVLPVLDGIAYAHEHDFAHRDIKPDNLKITLDGQVKVLDFGLVKFLGKQSPQVGGGFQTVNGMVIGSAGYMSPEQASGKPLDKRTDVFSLGILMYELLTGRNPFQASNAFATISKVLRSDPLSPELIRPNMSLPLSKVVLKCMSKDMDQRYADARTLFSILSDLKG